MVFQLSNVPALLLPVGAPCSWCYWNCPETGLLISWFLGWDCLSWLLGGCFIGSPCYWSTGLLIYWSCWCWCSTACTWQARKCWTRDGAELHGHVLPVQLLCSQLPLQFLVMQCFHVRLNSDSVFMVELCCGPHSGHSLTWNRPIVPPPSRSLGWTCFSIHLTWTKHKQNLCPVMGFIFQFL